MIVTDRDSSRRISQIAAAIGEPARVRILYSLLDGRARTSTELAAVADVTPSTTSVHLSRLKEERLVKVLAQGKHRYYSLYDTDVASALEALSLVAAGARQTFVPTTPRHLLAARTCYDHMAGKLAVSLHAGFKAKGWLIVGESTCAGCDLSRAGAQAFADLGIDLEGVRQTRRRFAYECLDWSERQPHLGGALGAAFLNLALKRGWVAQEFDSRALEITGCGRRELLGRFGMQL